MARRRMFSLDIIDTDNFLDMPVSSRELYFQLGMRADDEGFVSSPKKIMKMVGANEDDFKVLFTKEYIINFETGIIVITHWHNHNSIQNDRKHDTIYQKELNMLNLNNKVYTKCIQDVSEMETEVRLDKVSIGKDRLDKNREKEKKFIPPSIYEIKKYIIDKDYNIDAEQFYNFYESKGWMIGKNKMKSWHHAIETWRKRDNKQNMPIVKNLYG